MSVDIGLRLRELRRYRGMTQGEVAERSGLGIKTISSFETGNRSGSIKVRQLERLLDSYEVTIEQFFGPQMDAILQNGDMDAQTEELLVEVRSLPRSARKHLIPWMRSILRGATEIEKRQPLVDEGALRDARFDSFMGAEDDWDLLVCPN